jgi:hypothetical protein
MRPEEDRRGLPSRRPLVVGGATSVAPFGATALMTRWGWPVLEGGGGACSSAARALKAQRLGKAECLMAIFTRRRAERKRRGTRPWCGSYAGIRTRHTCGGGGCMGCAWSGGGGRSTALARVGGW